MSKEVMMFSHEAMTTFSMLCVLRESRLLVEVWKESGNEGISDAELTTTRKTLIDMEAKVTESIMSEVGMEEKSQGED